MTESRIQRVYSRNALYPNDGVGTWVDGYFFDHRGWWHPTEDEDLLGPYPSFAAARSAMDDYCYWLETGELARQLELFPEETWQAKDQVNN